MKNFLFLLIGIAGGAVATVMFFTLEIPYDGPERDGPGGGNARLSLDEDALALIVANEIARFDAFGPETPVVVRVHTHGLVDIDIGLGASPVGTTIHLVVDPEVIDGRLELVVVQAQVGGLIAPRQIVQLVERQLQTQLEALAAGFEYRLTAIITTERRLTLEIQI